MSQSSIGAELRLFPPAPGRTLEWRAINDGVMGGVSRGEAEIAREGWLGLGPETDEAFLKEWFQ